MGLATNIQWCDSTCNPTMGCDGCELWNPAAGVRKCYAGQLHARFGGVTSGYSPTFGELTRWPGRMAEAAGWPDLAERSRPGKPWLDGLPRLIFVSDMSDALSKAVSFEFLEAEVVSPVLSPAGRRHRWLWLTKRPRRMAEFSEHLSEKGVAWPENLWAGTSVTSQTTTARIPALVRVGDEHTTRFLSVEPQHGPVDLSAHLPGVDWVIQGGESGRGAAPFQIEWAGALLGQCRRAGVPYFLKQLGANARHRAERLRLGNGHGGDWSEWPEHLRVRQTPLQVNVTRRPAARHGPGRGTADRAGVTRRGSWLANGVKRP